MNLPYNADYKHAGGVWDVYGSLWKCMCDQYQSLNFNFLFAEHASRWGARWHQILMRLKDHYKAPILNPRLSLTRNQRPRTSRYESAVASN